MQNILRPTSPDGGPGAPTPGGEQVIERFSEALLLGTAITVDGRLVSCDRNLAAALEYDLDEVIQREAGDFVAPGQRADVAERIRSHELAWYEVDLVSKSGRTLAAVVIPGEMDLMGTVARTAVFLHRGPIRGTESRLLNALRRAVSALVQAIESRDPYTAGHQTRVATLAALISDELGLGDEHRHNIELAAIVHDVGKIAVPAEILVKPGRLSEAEWAIIKSHSEVGAEIIANVDCPAGVTAMVRSHHERLDGSGYPDGLADGEIGIETRILAVADALDAIAGVRPYHHPRTMADALDIIAGETVRYDGDVVEAARGLYARGTLEGREFAGYDVG